MDSIVMNEIAHTFPNFNRANFEVWKSIKKINATYIVDVLIHADPINV